MEVASEVLGACVAAGSKTSTSTEDEDCAAIALAQDIWKQVQHLLGNAEPLFGFELNRKSSEHRPKQDSPEARDNQEFHSGADLVQQTVPETDQKFFAQLRDSDECMDCCASGADWSSISFGIYLCMDCAGRHRGLGVHVSFVRSTTMDTWTEQQKKRMSAGGNCRFREFLMLYPQLQSQPTSLQAFSAMYTSRAASHYRHCLDALVEGRDPPSGPPSDQGHLAVDPQVTDSPDAPVLHNAAIQAALAEQWAEMEAVYLGSQHHVQALLLANPGLLEAVSQRS